MDGILLIHKPLHLTSHDVVDRIRKLLKTKKVGHFGTLDPLATGLLLIAVGKATRLFPFYSKHDKIYKGRIRMGFSTDTYDAEGKPTSSETKTYPDKKRVEKSIGVFLGEIDQVPPPYSAKKHKGRPLYAYARQNEQIDTPPARVVIHSFQLLAYDPPHIDVKVHCSSGTYIRSLAQDLGQTLGCGAHLAGLERTAIGSFLLDESYHLEDLESLIPKNGYEAFLIPLESLLPELSKIILKESGTNLAQNGSTIFAENIQTVIPPNISSLQNKTEDQIFRLFSPDGRLIALARTDSEKNGLHPFLVIDTVVSDK
ncbi:tRNA pseudouridine(55) synthase TruB [Acidobacteriota bacterium]